jgi:hypothetical protein
VATLRMIAVECEVDGPARIAEIIRLALSGESITVPAVQAAPSTPATNGNGQPHAKPLSAAAAVEKVKAQADSAEKRGRELLTPVLAAEVKAEKPRGNSKAVTEVNGQQIGPSCSLVVDALRSGPLSSGDIIKRLDGKLTSSAVYSALGDLRDRKIVETRSDPEDGYRKNFLVEASAE